MQLGSRFAEYGLTGAFFWIAETFVLLAAGKPVYPVLWVLGILRIGEAWPSAQDALTSLVSVLALIAVFVTGMILDLVASIFFQLEMNVFKRHVDRNDSWMTRVVANCGDYCADDYEVFKNQFGDPFSWRQQIAGFRMLRFWRRESRKAFGEETRKGWRRWKLVRPYQRLWNFLNAYVAVFSGASLPPLLVDQFYLWRTARAVAVTLFIVYVHSYFFVIGPENMTGWLFLAELAMVAAAAALELSTYSRLCFSLFALAYVTSHKTAGAKPQPAA